MRVIELYQTTTGGGRQVYLYGALKDDLHACFQPRTGWGSQLRRHALRL